MSYQKIFAVGYLGRDPEMRYTSSGKSVTNFSIATNERWTDADGQQHERTTWLRVATWGRLAEVCNEYLKKGRQVLVEGRLNSDPETGGPRVYTRNDGSSGASYEVVANRVVFLGKGNGSGATDDGGDPLDDILEGNVEL